MTRRFASAPQCPPAPPGPARFCWGSWGCLARLDLGRGQTLRLHPPSPKRKTARTGEKPAKKKEGKQKDPEFTRSVKERVTRSPWNCERPCPAANEVPDVHQIWQSSAVHVESESLEIISSRPRLALVLYENQPNPNHQLRGT